MVPVRLNGGEGCKECPARSYPGPIRVFQERPGTDPSGPAGRDLEPVGGEAGTRRLGVRVGRSGNQNQEAGTRGCRDMWQALAGAGSGSRNGVGIDLDWANQRLGWWR